MRTMTLGRSFLPACLSERSVFCHSRQYYAATSYNPLLKSLGTASNDHAAEVLYIRVQLHISEQLRCAT
jgi:hypothetical protein